MIAISVKRVSSKTSGSSRYRATCDYGSISIQREYDLSHERNAHNAAQVLAAKYKLKIGDVEEHGELKRARIWIATQKKGNK